MLASQTQSSSSSSSSSSSPKLNYNKIVQTHNTKTLRNPAPRDDEIRNPKKLEIRQVQEELLHHLEFCKGAAGVEVVVEEEEEFVVVIAVVRTQRINNPRLLFQWGWIDGWIEGRRQAPHKERKKSKPEKQQQQKKKKPEVLEIWIFQSSPNLAAVWAGAGRKKLSKGTAYLGTNKLEFVVVVVLLLPLIAI